MERAEEQTRLEGAAREEVANLRTKAEKLAAENATMRNIMERQKENKDTNLFLHDENHSFCLPLPKGSKISFIVKGKDSPTTKITAKVNEENVLELATDKNVLASVHKQANCFKVIVI